MRLPRHYWLYATLTLLAGVPVWAAQQNASFEVRQQHIANPAPTVRVQQGDTLVLALRSDAPLELHLHGYDLALSLKAGVPGRLQLQAQVLGRFPLSPHGKGGHHAAPLLYVEVTPR
jgi:FtsP/CotA-like multicopper oxidase with cupredoxin domain